MGDAAEQCGPIGRSVPGKFCRDGRFFQETRAGERLESLVLQVFSVWHGAC
jgi:hypothetical protein